MMSFQLELDTTVNTGVIVPVKVIFIAISFGLIGRFD